MKPTSILFALLVAVSGGSASAAREPFSQSTIAPLDYDSAVRCHAVLTYFSSLIGKDVDPSITAGVTDTRLFARMFGEDQGKSRDRVMAELATEGDRQRVRFEALDFGQPEVERAVGAEINRCLEMIANT